MLDAARVDWSDASRRAAQLRRCHEHLAKGLYAKAAEIHPATFGELIGYLDDSRASHYLDGPNDVDWVFRNEIEASREERLYVDYVAMDDGADWLTPARFDLPGLGGRTPAAVRLVDALTRAGVASPHGLAAVAAVWRDFVPEPHTHYQELASRIERCLSVLASDAAAEVDGWTVRLVLDAWPFPLHHVDLSKRKVDVADLRRRQQRWLADQAGY